MELILKVEQYQSQSPPSQIEHTFGTGGGCIGRSSANDWTLTDPSRFISGRHAEVVFDGSQFLLKDLSTNGTFLNGLDGSIGKGNQVPINSGDSIQIGEYLVSVTVQGAESAVAETVGGGEDWFDAPTDAAAPSPAVMPPSAPTVEPEPADAGGLDWFDESSQREDERALFVPEEPVFDADDPFAPSQAPEQEFFSPPQAADAGMIPDDWDPMLSQITSADDFRKHQAKAAPAPHQAPPAQRSAPVPPPAPSPRPAPMANTPDIGSTPQPGPKPAASPPPPPPQRPPPEAPQRPSPAMLGGGVVGGLGVEGLKGDPDSIAAEAGAGLRILITGLMEILAGRAQIKDEFRLSQTRIGPAMNNPLKFSPNVDEAIRRLFGDGESGFLGVREGMQQAIDDVKAHQVAMLVGMQAGLQAVLSFFEPEHLEKQLGESSGIASKMPGVREAKLWSSFTEVYERMAKDAEGDFHRLFGKEFAQAYEQQIGLLNEARKKQ